MSKIAIINGLTEKDIVLLYKFVNHYEKHLKHLKDNTKIKTEENAFREKKKSFTCKCYNRENLKKRESDNLKNEIYFTKSKGNKTLSFLYHLRNSIAHCLIKKTGQYYELKDKNRYNQFSMRGSIKCNILEEIVKIFLADDK